MESGECKEKAEREQIKKFVDLFDGHSFEVDIKTYRKLKDIIQTKSVRARLLFVAVAGLPNSGTSTLLHKLLNDPGLVSPGPRELGVYPAALFIDSVEKKGHVVPFNKYYESDGMLLVALEKQLITKQFNIHNELEDPSQLGDPSQLFQEPTMDQYFRSFCHKILLFREELHKDERQNNLVTLMKSHSFVNFLDITVNKAIYECLFIVGSWCKNGFLLCMLDICYYTSEVLSDTFDLSAKYFEEKSYNEEDVKLLKAQSACHFLLSIFEGIFAKQDEKKSLLVCLHKYAELNEAKKCKELQVFFKYAKDQNVPSAITSNPVFISNAEGSDEHKKLLPELVELIEGCLKYSDDIELRYLFFYSYLKSTGKMFFTREEVDELGSKCEMGMQQNDVTKCLQLLHNSCFVFCIKNFVIINLSEFIKGVSELYYIRSSKEATHMLNGIAYGFLPEAIFQYIWKPRQNLTDSTSRQSQQLTQLYTSSLISAGLMVKLKDTNEYFMPSMRVRYEWPKGVSSESLLIISATTLIPFHKQCSFVDFFQNQNRGIAGYVKVLDSPDYDVLKMQFQNEVELKIRFCRSFLEVSVSSNAKEVRDAFYSDIKIACSHVLNKIRGDTEHKDSQDMKEHRTDILDIRYYFAVCCPKSTSQNKHYIIFHDYVDDRWCNRCKETIDKESLGPRAQWMKKPGSKKIKSVHRDDELSIKALEKIRNDWFDPKRMSRPKLENLYKLFMADINKPKKETDSSAQGNASTVQENATTAQRNASVVQETVAASEQLDLSYKLFQALYTWWEKRSASRFTMALFLYDGGYRDEAFKLYDTPFLEQWLGHHVPVEVTASMQCSTEFLER